MTTQQKVTDKHFRDWESYVFGCGYGTGEPVVLAALRKFFIVCDVGGTADRYNYQWVEKAITPPVAWLLINALGNAGIIEWGVSARFGWLSRPGVLLRDFVNARTDEELYEILERDDEEVHCFPDLCQCPKPCKNPLWASWARPKHEPAD